MAVAVGASLPVLFNNVIDSFEFIHLGRTFGKDFKASLLKLDIARLRLSRWGEAVGLSGNVTETSQRQYTSTILSGIEIHTAERILGEILNLFAQFEDVSSQFRIGKIPDDKSLQVYNEQADLDPATRSLHGKMKQLSIKRQNQTPFVKKVKWALFSENQFKELIGRITMFTDDLDHLILEHQRRLWQLCNSEVAETFEDLGVLVTVAEVQDKMLLSVLVQVLKSVNTLPEKSQIPSEFQTTNPNLKQLQTMSASKAEERVKPSTCDDMVKLEGWIVGILTQASPAIQDGTYNALFKVVDPCEFFEFMQDGYPHGTHPRKVLTLTGTSEDAIAESAENYIEKIWGENGQLILDWIWKFFDIKNLPEDLKLLGRELSLKAMRPRSRANDGNRDWWSIQAQGSKTDIAAFALQLAWIFAAFRCPLESLALSTPEMQHIASGDSAQVQHVFALNLQSLKEAQEVQTSARCWNPIFRSLVIAFRFPIPTRPHEMRGVELPVLLMMSLAQLEYHLPYLDGFVLKGRTAVAVPKYKDKLCIQWHIIRNHDSSDLEMESFHEEAIGSDLRLLSCDTGASLEDFVESTVSGKNRHFLGLYPDSRIHLGTKDSKTQEIQSVLKDENEVKDHPKCLKWSRTFGISAGLGLPHGSLGVSTSFQLSVWTIMSTDPGPIETQVGKACKNLSVLYDTHKKVGWMVPEICVIFHLMRRHMQDMSTYEAAIHPAFEEINIADLPKKSLEYIKGSETVKKLFESFESRFRQMKELIIENQETLSFHLPFISSNRLCGVDFVHLSDLPQSWSAKRVEISETGSGGWAKVVKDQGKERDKQREMILVFFCKKLDPEPISPNPRNNTCGTWQLIPGNSYYLVTTYDCITSLSKRYGETTNQLASDRCWKQSEKTPFECATPNCDRLQKIEHKKNKNDQVQIDWVPPSRDAALVFGGNFGHYDDPCPQLQANATG